jgi:glycosyltransferase involved in cell wall biosynthesis
MIVKNEEEVLARCLDSVKKAVDEIIIMDTGSTDQTKAIARRYTKKVYDFKWVDDFSAARNAAFAKATKDYRMWLDADDVIPESELNKLIELKKILDPAVDIVTMSYYTHFDANDVPINISTRGRLFKRSNGALWEDPIHEYIVLQGNIYRSDIVIHHRQSHKEGRENRNILVYEKLEADRTEMSPRQLYYFARELKDHGLWAKSVYYFEKFLRSKRGWSEDNIASCHSLAILYNTLGDKEKVVPILIKAFEYGSPRAEIFSELGYYYKRERNITAALGWFKAAANLGESDSMGFILKDYWGYIPNIEACVCSSELGDIASAKAFNEKAALYKPDDPAVEYNRKYFASLEV